jgi:hypothetical protein
MAENQDVQKTPIHWVPAPGGVLDIYANLAAIQWSLDDVRVRLAQMVNSPETPNPGDDIVAIAQEKAAITVTWRGAKIMAERLAEAVKSYERVNGEILVDLELPKSLPQV